MKVAGSCHICGKPAFHTCILCGQAVCQDHVDEKGFTCRKCVPGKINKDKRGERSRASGGPGDPGGVMG
ncbi:MAG: hypothetical protein ACMUIG_09315 [Thermoplasmatota archaeon]